MEPLIVLIDLDGTIIGDVGPQVCEWEIISKYAPGKLKSFRKNLKTHFQQGLLRPHFTTFLDYIKHRHPTTEYYVYTASEEKWANVIIPCIEQEFGIKFNRPIFNRSHCQIVDNIYKKSPESIMPQIIRGLKKSYQISHHTKYNLIMIDNYNVMMEDEDDILIKCPTYEYICTIDVLRNIDEDVIQEHYVEISKALEAYKMFPAEENVMKMSYDKFKALYYTHLAKQTKRALKLNAKQDNFWKIIADLLTKKSSLDLSPKGIKHINTKLLSMV